MIEIPRIFKTTFSSIGKTSAMRFGVNYRFLYDIKGLNLFKNSKYAKVKLYKLLIKKNYTKLPKGDLIERKRMIDLTDVSQGTGLLLSERFVTSIDSDKWILDDSDILISKMEPENGKAFLNVGSMNAIGSTEWIQLSLDENLVLPEYLLFVLLTENVLSALGDLKFGKAQQRMSYEDFINIEIPLPEIAEQAILIKEIKIRHKDFSKLILTIKKEDEIIDGVLEKDLKLDLSLRLDIEKNSFETDFVEIATDRLLRSDYRGSKYRKLSKQIISEVMMPKYLSEIAFISGGKRLQKGEQYSMEHTDYRYLRNQDIENGIIIEEQIEYITEFQHNFIKNYTLRADDIVMAIAGTVGKVGLIPANLGNLNFTENLARIRIKNTHEVSPIFLAYILRSFITKAQYLREFTELRQQKLGLEKLRKFIVPIPNNGIQDTIVKDIHNMMSQNKKFYIELEDFRQNIRYKLPNIFT